MSIREKAKEIDFKSLIIGFLLATVLFLALGSSSGTLDVRIVGISTYDSLKVDIEEVRSSLKIPVDIVDAKYSVEIPVKIKDQPIEVKIR